MTRNNLKTEWKTIAGRYCISLLFVIMEEITIKAPCEAAHINERYVRIEISDFVMRTFLLDIFAYILYRT